MIKIAGEAMVATISQCVGSIDEVCFLLSPSLFLLLQQEVFLFYN
jgi:hypothetical protein